MLIPKFALNEVDSNEFDALDYYYLLKGGHVSCSKDLEEEVNSFLIILFLFIDSILKRKI